MIMAEPDPRRRVIALVLALAAPALALWLLLAAARLGRLGPDVAPLVLAADLWRDRAEPAVQAALVQTGALLFVLAAAVALRVALTRAPLHGAARFAGPADLARAGLRARRGLLLGRAHGRDLIHDGPEHLLVSAPTRTGKGASIVIPNLLTWPGSAVVLDIKRENHAATAGYRAACGQSIHLFDPLAPDGRTTRFNPLGHVDRHDPAAVVEELQRLGHILLPRGGEPADAFWSEAARTLWLGVGGLVAADPAQDFAIGPILHALGRAGARDELLSRLRALAADGRAVAPAAQLAVLDAAAASDNTYASVRQTLTARLGLWLNPRVDAATRASDLDIDALLDGRTTLYLAASPENLTRLSPLYGLLFQQLVDRVARRATTRTAHLLIVLDEFARLGPLPLLADAFAWIAAYGVRMIAVIQSPDQLVHVFGPAMARDLIANCGLEVVFAPKDIRTAQTLSERLGHQTWKVASVSRPLGLASGRPSRSVSPQRRPLKLAQELLALDDEALIVLKAGCPPVLARKVRYYLDRRLRRRVLPPPELPKAAALTRPAEIDLTPPEPDPEAVARLGRALGRTRAKRADPHNA